MSQTKCEVVREHLQKTLASKAQKEISFMIQTSNSTLETLGIKDKFIIIIWAKNFLGNNFTNKVLDKVSQMEEHVKYLKEIFKKLFHKGLPSF